MLIIAGGCCDSEGRTTGSRGLQAKSLLSLETPIRRRSPGSCSHRQKCHIRNSIKTVHVRDMNRLWHLLWLSHSFRPDERNTARNRTSQCFTYLLYMIRSYQPVVAVGGLPVKDEQHGVRVVRNSMNSILVPSGSFRSSCSFPRSSN